MSLFALILALNTAAFDEHRAENTRAEAACDGARHCALTFAASGSQAAYQGGVALRFIRERQKGNGDLAIAGSSVGALNALMAALVYCMTDEELEKQTDQDNIFLDVWSGLTLDTAFPGERSCSEYKADHPEVDLACTSESPYQPHDGIFTHNAFRPARRKLLNLLDKHVYSVGCRVPIALALTSERQVFADLGKQTVPTSRRTLLFRVEADPGIRDGGHGIHVCQAEDDPGLSPIDRELSIRMPEVMTRKGAPCRWIDRQILFDAIEASASVPPVFSPKTVDFCAAKELDCHESPRRDLRCPGERPRLCQERFLDGGVFDSRPVTAGMEAASLLPNPWSTTVHVVAGLGAVDDFVEPDHTDPACQGEPDCRGWPQLRAVGFYQPFFTNFFSVGRTYELQTQIRYNDDLKLHYIQPAQWLTGNYFLMYGALIDRRFIFHDYLAGLCHDADALTSCGHYRDLPPSWKFDVDLIERALARAHPKDDQHPFSMESFMRSLYQDDHRSAPCRFSNLAPPAWCDTTETYESSSADRTTHELPYIADYNRWTHQFFQQVLGRAEVIERQEHNLGMAGALSFGEFAESIRAADLDPGFQLGGYTAIPSRARGSVAGVLGLIFPSTIAAESIYYGRFRADWTAMSLRLDPVRLSAGAFWEPAAGTWASSFGPYAELYDSLESMPRLGQIGVRARYDVNGQFGFGIRELRPEIFVRPLYSRLEVHLGLQLGQNIVGGEPRERFNFGIGLSDVNGLVYWAIRSLTGSDDGYGSTATQVITAVAPIPK